MSAAAALVVAAALAGCGNTTYFAGRTLPPSGLTNRVLIAVQNPSAFSQGRCCSLWMPITTSAAATTAQPASFSISGYSGTLPITIQNMPEEQIGAVYGSGDGSFDADQLCKGKQLSGAVIGPERAFLQHLHHAQPDLRFRRQPAATCAHGGEPGRRRIVSAQPARRLSRERESRRLRGPGLCAELELHLLSACS